MPKGGHGKLKGTGVGGTVELRAGQAGEAPHKGMPKELLDDRKRIPRHAQIYLGTGLVGYKAQVS